MKGKSLDIENRKDRISFISNIKDKDMSIHAINNALAAYRLDDYYDEFEYLVELYAENYSVNSDHLKRLSKVVSLELIKNLENDNIKSILNMDEDNFDKFMNLFREENIKLNTYSINNIFESFAQRSFTGKNHQTISAFTATLNHIKKGKHMNAKTIMINVFKDNHEFLDNSNYNYDSLFDGLVKGDLDALKFYHEACNIRIDNRRNIFVKEEVEDYKNQCLEKSFETNLAVQTMVKYLSYESFVHYGSRTEGLTDKEALLLNNQELMNKIVEFKNKRAPLTDDVKENLFIFNRLMTKMFIQNQNDFTLDDLFETVGVKKTYKIPDVDRNFLLDIVCNLDYKRLSKILNNDDSSKGLDKLLNKYKFLSFNSNFYGIENDADTYCDSLTVASIIMNSDYILEKINESSIDMNMTTILDFADIYSQMSKKYEVLFGENNFRYLTLNPSPNKSMYSKNERREKAIEYLKSGYERKSTSVPSFDKEYNLKHNKKINVIIGNYTDPVNLTLGERTGSCARIGGLADSLFDFCQTNEKGFNIVFKTPDGRFASKVCGFRNGNSVFLNQLRESAIKDYDDNDLIRAIEQAVNDMVEISKQSHHPIENVIISEDRLMTKSKYKLNEIKFGSFFSKLKDDFALDISDLCAIILRSANKDNSLCEFKPGEEYSYKYEPVRDKIKYAQDGTKEVARLNALNDYLNGTKVEDLKIENKQYTDCFYGQDWYVAVDEEGALVAKVLDIARNNSKAQEELNKALEDILNMDKIFDNKKK